MKTMLPTLMELVLKYAMISFDPSGIQAFNIIRCFALFLKQKLQLWMFIPCNSKGEPLTEPKNYQTYLQLGNKE